MIPLCPLFCLAAHGLALATAASLSTVTLDCTSHYITPDHSDSFLDGTFKGQTNTTSGLISFRGIRYANPPLKSLRWQAPVSPPSTKLGTVSATSFGSACIGTTQTDAGPTTSEDCLFGNVFLPIATTNLSALPVLVYFHGGGFESGRTSKYPPENLVLTSSKPLIFATFSYRLGQFGFLGGTPVHDNGKAALQWVQRYIGKFGGDPGRVTIWGQSAGAALLCSTLPNYNDAVTESLFTQFASLAGCGNKATGAQTMSLATAGSSTLTKLTSSLYPFGPIADGSYIQERPVDALRNGNFVRVPVLSGCVHTFTDQNTDEGANWSAKLPNSAANTSSPTATETTVYNFLAGHRSKTAVAQYYPLSDYGGSFSLQGQQMYAGINPTLGSTHNDELVAFFDQTQVFDSLNEALVEAMRAYWTSFATSGMPVAPGSITWPAAGDSDGSPRLLLHPEGIAVEEVSDSLSHLSQRCEFWHNIELELDT
ncbi:alpha/beta-hydrolase [Mycena olivaceomarginata]|nr:alpha/beta-hydrolase [Mycena olivaceomarginata]